MYTRLYAFIIPGESQGPKDRDTLRDAVYYEIARVSIYALLIYMHDTLKTWIHATIPTTHRGDRRDSKNTILIIPQCIRIDDK